MGSPSSFCDWKKLYKFSAPSAAIFSLFPSGWWLTFSRPRDVQPCLPLTPSSPQWRRAFHAILGCAALAFHCIAGLICASPVIYFARRCIGTALQIFSRFLHILSGHCLIRVFLNTPRPSNRSLLHIPYPHLLVSEHYWWRGQTCHAVLILCFLALAITSLSMRISLSHG